MGSATSKCSDLNNAAAKTIVKPLDATDSEEEEELSDEEEEEEEDEDQARADAEDALNQGIQRGKSANFKEAIDHATSVGIDVEKILKAEAKLEEHKALRRREAFEADIKDYLENETGHDIEVCRDKLQTGTDYGCSDKVLQKLRDRIEELDVGRPLEDEEISSARSLIERHTRKFVQACVRGRPVKWVDAETGDKISATLYIDLVLHSAKVVDEASSELGCGDVTRLRARVWRHADSSIVSKGGFKKLSDDDKKLALCISPGEMADPWCIVEPSYDMRDEVVCGFMVLSGACIEDSLRSSDDAPSPTPAAPSKSQPKQEDQPPASPPPLPPPPVPEEEPPAENGNEVEEEEELDEELEEEEEEEHDDE